MKVETWIDRGLKKKGSGSVAGLARALGIPMDAVSKMRKPGGGRRPRAEELPLIEEFFGEPFVRADRQGPTTASANGSVSESLGAARVIGEIGGGAWYESPLTDIHNPDFPAETDKFPPVAMVHSKRFPGLPQFALKVVGPSVNKIVKDGAFAICVPWGEARSVPVDGDVVAVERRRGGMHQGTIKRLRRVRGQWELHPESTDARHQKPIRLTDELNGDRDDDSVEIVFVGLVIGQYGDVS